MANINGKTTSFSAGHCESSFARLALSLPIFRTRAQPESRIAGQRVFWRFNMAARCQQHRLAIGSKARSRNCRRRRLTSRPPTPTAPRRRRHVPLRPRDPRVDARARRRRGRQHDILWQTEDMETDAQAAPIERDLAADQRDLAEEALRRAALASARRLNVVVTPGRREGRQWRPLDESDSDDDSDDDL
jgi:hypothetical protein